MPCGRERIQMEEKITDYQLIIKQLEALADISGETIPIMSNASALLFEELDEVNWAGFYIVKGDELLLGPFQGKVACVKIEKGNGVCGLAWEKDCVQKIDDVHSFPGHIACDSASKSEIVIPIHKNGEVFAVLDIDSPKPANFSRADQDGLSLIARKLEEILENQNEL